jgi:hypothetical protein
MDKREIIKKCELAANNMRISALKIAYEANKNKHNVHFGPAFSIIDILATLYIGKMNMDGMNKGFEDEEMTVVQNVSRVMDNVTNASAQALEAGTNGTNGQNDSTSLDRLIMGVEKILGKMDGSRANGLNVNFNGDFNGDGKAIGDTTAKEIYTKLRQKGVIIGA